VIDLAPPHLWLRSPVELLRVDTVDLLPDVRAGLVALLRDLDPADWDRDTACPGWTVADVARHLLGVELGNVSRRRDGHRVDPPPGADLPSWLDGLNEGWVRAARLLSPRVIADLLDVAGAWFEAHAAGLDLDAAGPPVWWVGPEPAPVWLDVAREYTERWVHQQQIRDATGRPGLDGARYAGPVIATFVHALPRSLAGAGAAPGALVDLVVTGEGGGTWHAVRDEAGGWDLRPGPSADPACALTGTVRDAWRMYAGDPGATLAATGDPALATAALGGRAVITSSP
jgi:uncharacterized protein (TIGR03083 family)